MDKMATTHIINTSNPAPHLSSSGSHSSSSSNIVGVHYKVGKKIGEGSFGVIFEGGS
jgi:casein kinase 1